VSRSFAEQFWPAGDPIGRRVRRGPAAAPFNVIVGVVDDVRDAGLQVASAPTLYTPYFQGSSPAAQVALVVRTATHPSIFVGEIKRTVWSIDPNQPLSNIVVLTDYFAAGLGPQRFRAILVTLCGGFGLLLATIGTYAVTARSLLERTREIGVRIAIGGDPATVRWTMAATSLRAVVVGTLIGILGSTVAHAGVARLLPELDGPGWLLRAGAAAVLSLIGGAAVAIASRQAASVDPARALQAQ
jgi:ABC-type antimicrobial peptide transport system permease subunit